MSNLTDYGENLLQTFSLTADTVTRPTAWFVAIGTGHSESGVSGEPSGNGYARQAVTFTVLGNVATNTALLSFGPATASWGSMSSVGVYTAATGGNPIWAGALTTAKTIDSGDTLTIAAGVLSLTIG